MYISCLILSSNCTMYTIMCHINNMRIGSVHQMLFTGDRYWAYSEGINAFLDGYPRRLSAWGSFQGPVDAAFYSFSRSGVIFFSGDKFYEFNDDLQGVRIFMICCNSYENGMTIKFVSYSDRMSSVILF